MTWLWLLITHGPWFCLCVEHVWDVVCPEAWGKQQHPLPSPLPHPMALMALLLLLATAAAVRGDSLAIPTAAYGLLPADSGLEAAKLIELPAGCHQFQPCANEYFVRWLQCSTLSAWCTTAEVRLGHPMPAIPSLTPSTGLREVYLRAASWVVPWRRGVPVDWSNQFAQELAVLPGPAAPDLFAFEQQQHPERLCRHLEHRQDAAEHHTAQAHGLRDVQLPPARVEQQRAVHHGPDPGLIEPQRLT